MLLLVTHGAVLAARLAIEGWQAGIASVQVVRTPPSMTMHRQRWASDRWTLCAARAESETCSLLLAPIPLREHPAPGTNTPASSPCFQGLTVSDPCAPASVSTSALLADTGLSVAG